MPKLYVSHFFVYLFAWLLTKSINSNTLKFRFEFFSDEACSLCIFVVSGFTSDELTLANFTLAANAVIYQKENSRYLQRVK